MTSLVAIYISAYANSRTLSGVEWVIHGTDARDVVCRQRNWRRTTVGLTSSGDDRTQLLPYTQ